MLCFTLIVSLLVLPMSLVLIEFSANKNERLLKLAFAKSSGLLQCRKYKLPVLVCLI